MLTATQARLGHGARMQWPIAMIARRPGVEASGSRSPDPGDGSGESGSGHGIAHWLLSDNGCSKLVLVLALVLVQLCGYAVVQLCRSRCRCWCWCADVLVLAWLDCGDEKQEGTC